MVNILCQGVLHNLSLSLISCGTVWQVLCFCNPITHLYLFPCRLPPTCPDRGDDCASAARGDRQAHLQIRWLRQLVQGRVSPHSTHTLVTQSNLSPLP